MPIIRIAKRPRYTSIANSILEDERLSLKAKGLLAYLLSRPDNWTIHIQQLIKLSAHDGRDAIRSALSELVKTGYATFDQPRQNGQFVEGGWTIYEHPTAGLPLTGNPSTGNPLPENRPLLKTEKKPKTERKEKTEEIPPVFSCEEKTSPTGGTTAKMTLADLATIWNEAIADTILGSVQKLTPERQRTSARCFAIYPERLFWLTVGEKIAASPFLRGEKVGRDGTVFKATFDWLLKPGNAIKVYEGNYDETPMERAVEYHGVKKVKQGIVDKHQDNSFIARIEEKTYASNRRPQLLSDTNEDE